MIQFEPATKDVVIGAIKLVLKRLRQKGQMPEGVEYADLLRNSGLMHQFMRQVRQNPAIAADLLIGKKGQPVTGSAEPLICNLTLGQVERLLVYTCAKKFFATAAGRKPFSGGQTIPASVPDEVKAILAFEWQLPLLEAYGGALTPQHFRALGPDVLALRTVKAIHEVAAVDAVDVRKAKLAVGDRFREMLETLPAALRGLRLVDAARFRQLAALAGPGVWRLFAGDEQRLAEIVGCDPDRLNAIGANVADVCVAALREFEVLSAPTLAPFLRHFRSVFPDQGAALLGDEVFIKEMLRDIIQSFRVLERDNRGNPELVANAAALKWDALRPKLTAWLAQRGKTKTYEAAIEKHMAAQQAQRSIDQLFTAGPDTDGGGKSGKG